ncbi:Similar to emc7: ER membrane protein complex subunit 7 (Xenopus tropicalis) [Cotesia congregata]|uniref:Similar to emc7: ER membrane protein complex subunit 7 (Xenopus tropicalis) n=1 Tax=Cotesia congregata TaxID=51543 RepID=A0A8J2HBM5_COTCN|nr:Similar to emc7: ER membrane protein complex subunit 7 (Xenopus tropicalis) [Cotesia congregata]
MNFINKSICLLFIFVNINCIFAESDEDLSNDLYVIEGKVFPWDGSPNGWQLMTHVMANVVNPNYAYEPVRVEINSKGKFRARKVNLIQTSQVIQVPYPLKMRAVTPFRYFQVREQWRVADFLFSPMVLMMILPLLLIMVIPKVMNDPETRKDLEQFNSLTSYNMPEMSEVITSFLTGNDKQKTKAIKATKKRQ